MYVSDSYIGYCEAPTIFNNATLLLLKETFVIGKFHLFDLFLWQNIRKNNNKD